MKSFMMAALNILRITMYVLLKLLTFAVSIALVLIQFILGFVVLVLSLGAIGSSTVDFGRRR